MIWGHVACPAYIRGPCLETALGGGKEIWMGDSGPAGTAQVRHEML